MPTRKLQLLLADGFVYSTRAQADFHIYAFHGGRTDCFSTTVCKNKCKIIYECSNACGFCFKLQKKRSGSKKHNAKGFTVVEANFHAKNCKYSTAQEPGLDLERFAYLEQKAADQKALADKDIESLPPILS